MGCCYSQCCHPYFRGLAGFPGLFSEEPRHPCSGVWGWGCQFSAQLHLSGPARPCACHNPPQGCSCLQFSWASGSLASPSEPGAGGSPQPQCARGGRGVICTGLPGPFKMEGLEAVRRGSLGKKPEQLASLGLPRFPELASMSSAPPTSTPPHHSPSVHLPQQVGEGLSFQLTDEKTKPRSDHRSCLRFCCELWDGLDPGRPWWLRW